MFRKKKKCVKRLDDLKKWRIEMLARFGGFSRRYIASEVFGSSLKGASKSELVCISSYIKRIGVRLRDWRDGLTISAQAHAKNVSKPKKVKRYRISHKAKAA